MVRDLFKLLGAVPPGPRKILARWLGLTAYALDRKHRQIVRDNLNRVFGREKDPARITRLARQTFVHFSLVVFEIGWLSRITPEHFSRHCRVEGAEHYRRALARNRGVLALTGHMGNWELLPVAAGNLVDRPGFVYRPMDSPVLDRFFINQRTRMGAVMISSARAMRPLLRLLHDKGTVVVLPDQSSNRFEGVFVDFFGQVTCTNKGLALMALKTGAPVVPIFLVREKDHFLLKFFPALPLIKTGDKTRDVEENTRQYNLILEKTIRQYPEQWFWMHRRWKTPTYCLIADRPEKFKSKGATATGK
ncbi:MAG: lysophospholipid acyltransferase family protein [Desulfosudaceae bacterium]